MILKSTSRARNKNIANRKRGSFTLVTILLVGLASFLATSWWLPVTEVENLDINQENISESETSFSSTTVKIVEILPEPVKDVLTTTHDRLENLFKTAEPITAQAIIKDTNLARRNAGVLKDLTENRDLNLVAQKRLEDMFAKQYFEHTSPEGVGASDVAEVIGYKYLNIAENLAVGDFVDSNKMVLDWMNSPGHRANIVNDKFSEIGVAVSRGEFKGQEVWLGVQIFTRPHSECKAPSNLEKSIIDQETTTLDQMQTNADKLLVEIRNYEQQSNLNQSEYNDYQQKISQYNQLANELNRRSQDLQLLVSNYNTDVRAYNVCIQ